MTNNTAPPEDPPPEEAKETQKPPPAPGDLSATGNADGHVVLSWNPPDDDSVTGYQVLRRRPDAGHNSLSIHVEDTSSTATAYTDSDVTPGSSTFTG